MFIYRLSESIRISNCWFDGGGFGINVGGTDTGNDPGVISDVLIENNSIQNVTGESIDINQDCRNFIIRNNFCYNSNTNVTGLTPTDAENIDVGGIDALQYGLIDGNTIVDFRQYIHGIQVKQATKNLKITNNRIFTFATDPVDTWGVRIAQAVKTQIIGNLISGYSDCIFSSASASDNSQAVVTNNIIENFVGSGIAVASNQAKIQNNLVDNTMRSGGFAGVFVTGSSSDVEITGNTVFANSTTDYGIRVNGAINCPVGNNSVNGGEIGISLVSLSRGTVTGNSVNNSQLESLIVENSTNVTATGNSFANGNQTGGTWSITYNNVKNGIFSDNAICDTRSSGQTMLGTVNADLNCEYIVFTGNSIFNTTVGIIGINGAVVKQVLANNLT
jgi:parallel beta-helix repeat protein